MDPTPAHAYTIGQRVRSRSLYHTDEVGTVVVIHPTPPRPGYIVEFAGGACAFLREDDLEAAGADG
jgi:hypothetical protein